MMYGVFASWYDAIYCALGKDYEKEACRVAALIEKHRRATGKRLLDVGCGTGEHLRYLRRFYTVEGLDSSEAMLSVARQKVPDVPLHYGAMQTFRLPDRYDAVVCLFGSIGYAATREELSQSIANMSQHLTPGGVLVVEPWFSPTEARDGKVQAVLVDEEDLKLVRIARARVKGSILELEFHFLVGRSQGVEYFKEIHTLGLYTREEYEGAFAAAGLTVHVEPDDLFHRDLLVGVKPTV